MNQLFLLAICSTVYIDHLRVLREDTERKFIGENLKGEHYFLFLSVMKVFSQRVCAITVLPVCAGWTLSGPQRGFAPFPGLKETQLMIFLARQHLRARKEIWVISRNLLTCKRTTLEGASQDDVNSNDPGQEIKKDNGK